ncbi:MAG: AAA family ATPase [Stenomitos rutilans HA7619-LM2]|nr:AAA family ATPase [Stenomitos rutilans HA7619-LM2]
MSEPLAVRFILLVGLPGSGKSSFATALLRHCPQRRLIATDAIRFRLFGDEALQGHWLKVWHEVGAVSTNNPTHCGWASIRSDLRCHQCGSSRSLSCDRPCPCLWLYDHHCCMDQHAVVSLPGTKSSARSTGA